MRLPLREALYVCSNCRQEAVPRVSPLARQFQLQTRRYASDSPSFLDRTRRKIWNTEKPPGAEDPYTGDSQLLQPAEKSKGGLAGGVNAEGELGEGEESSLAEGDGYTQAEDWKGLTTVGYLPEEKWIQTGTIKADKYRPYVLILPYYIRRAFPKPPDIFSSFNAFRFGHQVRPLPILEASYQAAVEICLLHLLGKPLTSICDVKRHNPQIRQMLESCTVQPSGEKGWDIMFPDEKTKETLVFVFNQIGGKSNGEIKSTGFVERDRKDVTQLYRSLSLDDPNIKFAVCVSPHLLACSNIC